MVLRKNDERVAIEADLARQGIQYAPMVLSHFGSLHPKLDAWITSLCRAHSRRTGCSAAALERQFRGRLGADIARRAGRMSLATWGAEPDDGGVILPLVDYLDLDRTSAHFVEQFLRSRGPSAPAYDPGRPPGTEGRAQTDDILSKKPAWDPGIQVGWSSAGRWCLRMHGQEGVRSGTYMLGFSEPPGLRESS